MANIDTWHRRFLVVAGWSARRSLDAQNADGLRANEAAIHSEDHQALHPAYKRAFGAWENTDYRKATAAALERAEMEIIREGCAVEVKPRTPAIVIPKPRPYHP